MNQAEEDALVESAFMSWLADGNRNVYELMRLAIRAAVAAERERAERAEARAEALTRAISEWASAHGEMEQKTRGILPGDARLFAAEKALRAAIKSMGGSRPSAEG